MKKCCYIALLLFYSLCFCQNDLKALQSKDDLENYTYAVLDEFLEHPSKENLTALSKTTEALWRKPKTNTEKTAMVVLLCNLGYYENQLGKITNAIVSYEKAWRLFETNKLKDYDIVEFCLKPLGNLYTVLGDYDNAENTIKQYYFIANLQKNNVQKVAAVLNLSNVYQSSGKVNLAIELLENTLKAEKIAPLQKAILLNNLGSNYIANNDFDKAKTTLELAVKLLKNEKNQQVTLPNAYRNLVVVFCHEKDFAKANKYFEKAQQLFFETKNQEQRKIARFYYDKGLLLYQQKKIEAAQKAIIMVFKTLIPNYDGGKILLPKQNALYAETVLLDALDLQASIFSEQAMPEKALESYSLSFYIEEIFQSFFVYENTKLIAQLRNRKRTENCLKLYEILYKKDKNSSWIEKAFLLSERTRSGVLKAAVSDAKRISAKEKLLMTQLQNWNTTIVKEQQKGNHADISAINTAIKNQNELMLKLKSIRSKNKTTRAADNLDVVFKQLKKDKAAMVSYFSGFEETYCFILRDNGIEMRSFSSAANAQFFSFLSYFNNADAIIDDVSGYRLSALKCYNLLDLPKDKTLKNLIIIPDGILNFLPFEALLTAKTSTTDFSKMPYLINDYRITYNNSVAFYTDATPFGFEKETVLGLFPIFENTPLELSFSVKELDAIKRNFTGVYLEKEKATFRNFKSQAKDFSVLHLSTHALAGDVETPASIRFYDQEILYSELYALDIRPNLVVLSACETGIGKLYKGEGAMSVARGFQFAGAQNLLFSLWKVNDYTTSVLMSDFYDNIKKGYSYGQSNHNAKRNYLKSTSIPNAKKSPYYWSAMVYYGTLEEKPTTNYLGYLAIIVAAIVLFLIWKKSKSKKIATKNE